MEQYLKIVVQAIVQDEGMCHLDAMWLHWMLVAVMVVANFWVIEVCNLSTKVTWGSGMMVRTNVDFLRCITYT